MSRNETLVMNNLSLLSSSSTTEDDPIELPDRLLVVVADLGVRRGSLLIIGNSATGMGLDKSLGLFCF